MEMIAATIAETTILSTLCVTTTGMVIIGIINIICNHLNSVSSGEVCERNVSEAAVAIRISRDIAGFKMLCLHRNQRCAVITCGWKGIGVRLINFQIHGY